MKDICWSPVIVDLYAAGGYLSSLTMKLYIASTITTTMAPDRESPFSDINATTTVINPPLYLGRTEFNLREIFSVFTTPITNPVNTPISFVDNKEQMPTLLLYDKRRI